MEQTNFLRTKEAFPGCETVRKHSFETMITRDNYALLARENRKLAMDIAISVAKSALFGGKDCFECLSPHKIAA